MSLVNEYLAAIGAPEADIYDLAKDSHGWYLAYFKVGKDKDEDTLQDTAKEFGLKAFPLCRKRYDEDPWEFTGFINVYSDVAMEAPEANL